MSVSAKSLLPAACLAVVTLLAGCNRTLDFRNAEISNSKVYSAGSNTGFSGKVTNVPLSKLPAGKIAELTKLIGNVTKDGTLSELVFGYALAGAFGNGDTAILCDIQVDEGILNGDATCKAMNNGVPLFNLPFKNGVLDGKAIVYDLKQNGAKIAEAIYAGGEMNGPSKVFSASNGKVLDTAVWQNGIANGPEEIFDATTGNRIVSATLKNGKYDGEVNSYSADGKLIAKKILKDGVVQADPQAIASSKAVNDACVDLWIASYRKEQGTDAAASADQIEEWAGWCQQGKRPEGK